MLTLIGLYYKLHGVHRPVTMKKSVIKRRKRVVPAAMGSQAGMDVGASSIGSPDSDETSPQQESHDHRGSINPDGSVNLGFKQRPDPSRNILPEPTSSIRQNGQQLPHNDLNAYISHPHNNYQHQDTSSLNADNKLPPMAAYPSPTQRPPSLSPNFLLTPSRKRSFSAAETDSTQLPPLQQDQNNNRLSSIKSILNPAQQAIDESNVDPTLRTAATGASPGPRYATMPSPNPGYAPSPSNSGTPGRESHPPSQAENDRERAKLERRAELQREAERMREMLAAKERELA